MPTYRCYFLDSDGRIKDAVDLEADDLSAAIDKSLSLLRERPTHHSVEIWQAAERLYASPRDQL